MHLREEKYLIVFCCSKLCSYMVFRELIQMVECGISVVNVVRNVGCRGNVVVVGGGGVGAVAVVVTVIIVQLEILVVLSNKCNSNCRGSS
jgi:F0F1-type ATP synthase beta subunit